ncbi:LysR family transcriptional regulator [Alcaligenes sp. SDU_A2]|uniref:LysR family transcriptional regulator n=1 Tax=Alcaligenes sp. SDU_A2 TaxID=3136634 RepID=UPI00311F61C9
MEKIGFELRQIQMLVAVGKTRSFSTAAQQLNVSQAAISQNIAKLEEHYGVLLVQRHSRPVCLTDAGKKLVKLSEAWLSQAAHMQNFLQFSHSSRLRHLRIGIIDSITSVLAPFIVENFSDRAHTLSVQSGVISSLDSAFKAGELDLLVTTNVDPGTPPAHSFLLVQDPYVLIAPCQHARLTFTDMVQQLSYIGYDKRSQIGQRIQAIFTQHDIKVNNTIYVDSFDTLSKLVSSGVGWGLISAFSLQGITALSPHLLVRNVFEGRYSRNIHLISNPSLPPDLIDSTRAMFQTFLNETVSKKIQQHFPLITF